MTDNAQRLTDIAEVLELFPEVKWDRTAQGGGDRIVFGWIDRPDDHADFLLLTFTARGGVGMTTSSAELSLDFHRRLFGVDRGHGSCQRVEHIFGPLVTNAIRLDAELEEEDDGS